MRQSTLPVFGALIFGFIAGMVVVYGIMSDQIDMVRRDHEAAQTLLIEEIEKNERCKEKAHGRARGLLVQS